MITNSEFKEIICRVKSSVISDWKACRYETDLQSMDRLCIEVGRFDVDINRIRHGKGAHIHACDVMSLILDQGYGYWLRQSGASVDRYHFAAPGSIIMMGPEDAHWIPEMKTPSTSLFIAERHFRWHLSHPAMSACVASELLLTALISLSKMKSVPDIPF